MAIAPVSDPPPIHVYFRVEDGETGVFEMCSGENLLGRWVPSDEKNPIDQQVKELLYFLDIADAIVYQEEDETHYKLAVELLIA